MAEEKVSRRDFLLYAMGGWAAVGLGGVLYAMYKTWEPLPEVKAAGTVRFDLSKVNPGELKVVQWRGKPVFVLRRTPDMDKCENRSIKDEYTVVIGICTHLGCIPNWEPDKKIFKCPCHGGEFNACGVNIFGPPPRPLDIPPFKIEGTTIVLGETGPEYEKMMKG
ncbi:ubiquinol-cytochrome c reductase iron-sulfur subunit [Persephonella hydrogeniphila]|uniref:Ubiquinol-cytochrome c reductase iron-sulfur subunit n=1 Tax=Persephonella hydrogeniphila TaxID=198703 RepID=A0A285NJQ6_9AQUI|nr:ubiquinol-cytochrome c reductase iron-sulfur subunit [Persephonella hydrogeniphila]SNZ07871.1 ubiquinol-cytochrome c reductase iron-sulfur subunit [Persephonella hydrogeniphila]